MLYKQRYDKVDANLNYISYNKWMLLVDDCANQFFIFEFTMFLKNIRKNISFEGVCLI